MHYCDVHFQACVVLALDSYASFDLCVVISFEPGSLKGPNALTGINQRLERISSPISTSAAHDGSV